MDNTDNISNTIDFGKFMNFADCCTSIYHLHSHHLHFYNSNASTVFNSTLQKIIQATICKQDIKQLSVNSMSDITVIAFFICCTLAILFMLIIYVRYYLRKY